MKIDVTPVREWVINSISKAMKLAISVGIGFFLAFIGLQTAGIVAADPTTLVKLGDLKTPQVGIAVAAFLLMAALEALKVRGAILIGILAAFIASLALGLTPFAGLASMPPSIAPVLLQMDIPGALDLGLAAIVFTFFFVVVFDNTGTLIGVANAAGLMAPMGRSPASDGRSPSTSSTAAMVGAALGTSTTTSYVESAAGVNAGGRTGLVAVPVAVLFLATLFLAPLALY